ncbi:MAG: DEAD/DEAH box helicase [Patescibacteria group bacterium]
MQLLDTETNKTSIVPEVLPGLTGSEDDGVLTPEQQEYLDRTQEDTALNIHTMLETIKQGDKYPLVAMATGIGKGRIIHKVIQDELLFNPQSRILVIAGTKSMLVEQTRGALKGYIESENDDNQENNVDLSEEDELEGYSIGKIGSPSQVEVTTIQGIQKKKLHTDDYDLVIVDEVHNIGTQQRYEAIKRFKRVVGFTATPYRHTGQMKIPESYGFTIIETLSLPEAQELELLPPLYARQIDTKELIENIPTLPSGKIDFKRLERLIRKHPELQEYIVDTLIPILSDGYKTVISVNFVTEAEKIALLLKEKGVTVGIAVNQQSTKNLKEQYDGLGIATTDSIERYKLSREDPRSVQVLISPYVASEGFDAPATEIMVWASPTDSTLRYTQYTGRLARRNPQKAYGIVIDFLYQTDQFGWSRNFAQFFKDVYQLPSGTLYMGPLRKMSDIAEMKLAKLLENTQTRNIKELQNTGEMDEVQENDFVISTPTFKASFTGRYGKLKPLSDEVVDILKEEGIIVYKRNGSHIIPVCTRPERYFQEMESRGATRKQEMDEVQENDFVINETTLTSSFIGIYGRLKPLSDEVIDILKEEGLIVYKRNGSHIIPVCTRPERYFQEMESRGATRKPETDEVQESDFVINQNTLDTSFTGGYRKSQLLSDEVVDILKEEGIIVYKRNGSHIIPVCTSPERYFQEMETRGATRKQKMDEVQENDFVINQDTFQASFIGRYEKLKPLSDEVVDMLKKEGIIAYKRNGSRTIPVCTKPERYFQEMETRGAEKRQVTVKVQENDFVINKTTLNASFIGGYIKLKPLSDEVVDILKEEGIIVYKRNHGHIIPVCTNPEMYFQEMKARGARIRRHPSLKV